MPPPLAVPYRMLPDELVINPPAGLAPSLLIPEGKASAVKLCRVVRVWAVTRPASIKPRPAISTGRRNHFLWEIFTVGSFTGSTDKSVGWLVAWELSRRIAR